MPNPCLAVQLLYRTALQDNLDQDEEQEEKDEDKENEEEENQDQPEVCVCVWGGWLGFRTSLRWLVRWGLGPARGGGAGWLGFGWCREEEGFALVVGTRGGCCAFLLLDICTYI